MTTPTQSLPTPSVSGRGWRSTRPWLDRLLVAVTSVSVRTKIMGIVLVLTLTLGLSVTLQVRQVMYTALLSELDNRGRSVASDLSGRAAGMMLDGNVFGLTGLLVDVLRNHPDTRYAFIVDEKGQVITHTFYGQVPGAILAVNPAQGVSPRGTHIHYQDVEGQIHDFAMPILDGKMGIIRLGMAETRLQEIIDNTTQRMLLTTAAVAAVGILAAILLTWLLTRPILDLVTTTDQLRQGNLRVRAPHWTDDEIGALADAFNLMVRELEQSQQMVAAKEEARTHLLSRLISVQEEERKRIARELHDGVGQALTSILVHIKLLAQQRDPAHQARLSELRRLVDETLVSVRLLSRELRPSALDDLGLAAALERYVSEFGVRFPHIRVDLHCTLPHRLPTDLEISLYRIIQEAMTNSARHSSATDLSVVVGLREQHIQAIIEDNGRGFDVAATRRAGSSVGLHNMIERSELLNGSLTLESNAGGTTVYVDVPLPAASPHVPENNPGDVPGDNP